MLTGCIFVVCFVLFILGIISGGSRSLFFCFLLATLSACFILGGQLKFIETCIVILAMSSYYLLCNRNM